MDLKQDRDSDLPPQSVTFARALRYWLWLGFVSFGGPAGQIAIMHRDLVERRRWVSEKRFLHALNYCMLLPGPEAQQLATYLGWLLHRTWGGIAAGVLFVLPSFVVLVALSWIYVRYGQVPLVAAALYGMKPAVTAIVLAATWRIGQRALQNPLLIGIAVGAFAAMFAFGVPFPAIIGGAALVGALGVRLRPQVFSRASSHQSPSGRASLIDDHTPTPVHARWQAKRALVVVAAFLGIWAGTIGVLVVWEGSGTLLVQMAWFFTKAALLTFGGAYAVLPYVQQAAVEQFGWVSTGQMMDGLALGETTPGPLIMIVTFVGFVAGWQHPGSLASEGFWAGLQAASAATFFTFLPSFFFIFLGAPLVERTRGQLGVEGPLAGVRAAVVGVLAHLAVSFGLHVFFSRGAAEVDIPAIGIAALATVALIRFQIGVVPVILASASMGWLVSAFGPEMVP